MYKKIPNITEVGTNFNTEKKKVRRTFLVNCIWQLISWKPHQDLKEQRVRREGRQRMLSLFDLKKSKIKILSHVKIILIHKRIYGAFYSTFDLDDFRRFTRSMSR